MIWVLTARFHPIRSANPGTWKNTKYKNRIFSEIDFELRVLYREEVVQSAWLNYGKISSSDQAEPQRLLYNIEMKKKRNSLRNRYHAYHMPHIKKISQDFLTIFIFNRTNDILSSYGIVLFHFVLVELGQQFVGHRFLAYGLHRGSGWSWKFLTIEKIGDIVKTGCYFFGFDCSYWKATDRRIPSHWLWMLELGLHKIKVSPISFFKIGIINSYWIIYSNFLG